MPKPDMTVRQWTIGLQCVMCPWGTGNLNVTVPANVIVYLHTIIKNF